MARRAYKKTELNVPIISTISKQIPTKELLLRLQKIADTLSGVDQDDASLDDYRQLAENLSNKKLLFHKNAGILAYTCCSITDILRIFAPDAPFSPETLTEIFRAIFAQFAQMWIEENAYFQQQCYILKRIVEVRSVVLIADLPKSDLLVTEMFNTMYSLAGKGFPSRLTSLASEMLAETVSEADSLPQATVSLILKKLVVPAKYPVASEESNISNTAFSFSLCVCEANTDKMARHVSQHFSEMLNASISKLRDNDEKASYSALEKIHGSSVHIWAYLPELLSSVMGLIGDELNSDSEKIRLLATTSIGSMLACKSSTGLGSSATRFITAHRSAWNNWLKKSSDISAVVRVGWVRQVVPILSTQTLTTEVSSELCTEFSKCLMDANEKVRLAVCEAIRLLPTPLFFNKLCTEDTLNALLLLCREKHVDIRNESIYFLAELYNYYLERSLQGRMVDFGGLNDRDTSVIKKWIFSIPNSIIQLNYVNDKLLTATVDVVLFEQLIPFIDDVTVRMSRFCLVYESLDSRGKAALSAVKERQKRTSDVLHKYVDFAEHYAIDASLQAENKENAGVDSKSVREQLLSDVDKAIRWLVASFPSGIRSYECVHRYFQLRNLRLISLLKHCIDTQLDYKSVKNSIKETLIKVSEEKNIKLAGDSLKITVPDMVSTLKLLLYRGSFILYNPSNVGQILEFCKDSESRFHDISKEVINDYSVTFPAGIRAHKIELASMVMSCKERVMSTALIRTFYHFGRRFPESLTEDVKFKDFLAELAATGDSNQAKYAVKLLCCYGPQTPQFQTVIGSILPFSVETTNATHLNAVAQLYWGNIPGLSKSWNCIVSFIIEELLRKNTLQVSERNSGSWIKSEELDKYPTLNKKVCGLALLINRVRSLSDVSEAPAIEKTVKLLCAIISNNGEIVKVPPYTPDSYKAYLRYVAGVGLLKLAQVPSINEIVTQEVMWKLSRLLHDENTKVREYFFEALKKRLSRNCISERFLFLVFFLGHEPMEELKKSSVTWVLSQHSKAKSKKNLVFESCLVRLVYAIAHDEKFTKYFLKASTTSDKEVVTVEDAHKEPELMGLVEVDTEVEAFLYALKYVSMYLDSVVTEENCSLLYYFASRVKQYRCAKRDEDAEVPTAENLNLYRVAELSQLMIKEYSDSKGWTIQTWPGKLNLPSDIFTLIDDFSEALEVISRVYIQDNVQVELRTLLAKPGATKAKRKPVQKLVLKKTYKRRSKRKPAAHERDGEVIITSRRSSSRVTRKVSYQEVDEQQSEQESEEYVNEESD